MNIIVIISDTLRQDHLGCYGNKKIHTPNLDRFAKKCIQFDNAYTASFPTMPMRADLMTGKLSFTSIGWAPLPAKERTLGAILQKADYTTMAVVDTPFYIRDGFNYDKGFKDFQYVRGQQTWGECATSGKIEKQYIGWGEGLRTKYERRYEEDYFAPKTIIEAQRSLEYYYRDKFFLYIDMWDPHEPWDPPHWYAERYYPGYDGTVPHFSYWDWAEQGMSKETLKLAHACYCGEISMVDHWVGHLLDKIELMGLLKDTMIVFTADHGFCFGEHGFIGKSVENEGEWYRSCLYEEISRVPLLVYVPRVKPRRTKALVSHIDLMPTLLDMAGLKRPDGLHGASFADILRDGKDEGHEFVVSSFPLANPGDEIEIVDGVSRAVRETQPASITTARWVLAYSTEDEPVELFDLKNDPKQKKNVLNKNKDVAKELHNKYVKVLEKAGTSERLLKPRKKIKL